MTDAVKSLAESLHENFEEFTVFGTLDNTVFGHQWYIGTHNTELIGKEYTSQLDGFLRDLNDDYAVERDHALKHMKATFIPIDWFNEWMRVNDKEGSQHKFPRVMKGETLENWQSFLEGKGIAKRNPA